VGRRFDHLEFGNGGVAETVDLGEKRPRRRDHLAERPESRNQGFRQRLDIPPRQRTKQHKLQKFVVADRIAAGGAKSPAQAFPMTKIMGRRFIES
jgi:hypothetical protein